VRQGRLDLHGHPSSVTWTRLSQTAWANATSLALQQSVDWATGDRLVLAPTGRNGNETEVRGTSTSDSGSDGGCGCGRDRGSGYRRDREVAVGM